MINNSAAIATRLKRLRDNMEKERLDGVLITKRENYIYLSGFTGTSAYLVITSDKAILVTDFRYAEQAAAQATNYEIVEYKGSSLDELGNIVKNNNISRLGFEETYMTYGDYLKYRDRFSGAEMVPLRSIVEEMRMVKDPHEIETIKKAVEVADNAFRHILDFIKPGVTETELAAELEYNMKKQGATGPSFETIVASGLRSSMPHGVASKKTVQMGEAITFDFGALYDNYCSDMTRTVFLGTPKDELRKIYDIVLKSQLLAIEGAKAGLMGKDIDAIARNYIAEQGFKDNFGHGLGHGVGLEIHEEPRFSPSGNITIKEGMVITVEPGIYVQGLGGVRIEDIIVIESDGCKILTQSTKEVIIL